MSLRRVIRALASGLLLAVITSAAHAHVSRPISIEVTETAPDHYALQWKTPPSMPLFNVPTVALPRTCAPQSALAEFIGPDGLVRRMAYRCSGGLAGQRLSITYPGPNPSVSSLVRFTTTKGERHTAILGPQEVGWSVPAPETTSGVARQYTLLGIEHIWSGFDHLLFLVCLLWIARTWQRIVVTITGFTLAHSLTLALYAQQVVRVPVPPVEASIALSIVFVAAEIAKGTRESLTWRYPIAVSSSFGLLHGFGFAAALAEVGLPQAELVTGLLFFNVGVEIGQILFATTVLAIMAMLRRVATERIGEALQAAPCRMVASYAVGTLAVFWLIDRSSQF